MFADLGLEVSNWLALITDLVINVGLLQYSPYRGCVSPSQSGSSVDPLLVTRLGAVGAVAPAPILPAVAPATLTTLWQYSWPANPFQNEWTDNFKNMISLQLQPPMSNTAFLRYTRYFNMMQYIAIFSRYFSDIKLVKNMRKFLQNLSWER